MAVSRYTSRVVALEAEQQAYRVLVAEDNQNNRSLMVTLLKTVGFEVQEAVNGREAVEQWREWKPHLIWMDMRMPIMDGYEATTQIKASPGGKDSVIIALTANAFEEDRIKVIEHGCDDFVRKPYRASEIFEMINKHLGVHYIYAEDDGCLASGNSGDEVPDARLITFIKDLPEGVIVRLKEAMELSDAAMIDEVIEEIRTDNVQLAEALSALAENFAYDEILALADGSRSF
jgi:CheY-like chemotaxis protein